MTVPLTLRQTGPDAKNSPLTNAEVDQNFINLSVGIELVNNHVNNVESELTNAISDAIASEVTNRNDAISNAIDTEVQNRNIAIQEVKDLGINPNAVTRITSNRAITNDMLGGVLLLGQTVIAYNNSAVFPDNALISANVNVGEIAAIGDAVAESTETLNYTVGEYVYIGTKFFYDNGVKRGVVAAWDSSTRTLVLSNVSINTGTLDNPVDTPYTIVKGDKLIGLTSQNVRWAGKITVSGSNTTVVVNTPYKRLRQLPATSFDNWDIIAKPSNITLTLPKITADNAGKVITLKAVGAADTTILPASGDRCHQHAFGAFSVPAVSAGYRYSWTLGNAITITNDGVNKWYIVSDQNQTEFYYYAFPDEEIFSSKAYWTASGGQIIQEGGIIQNVNAGVTEISVTLPVTYASDVITQTPVNVFANIAGYTNVFTGTKSDPNTISFNVVQVVSTSGSTRYITGFIIRVHSTVFQSLFINWLASGQQSFGALTNVGGQ